MQRYWNKKNN